MRESVFKETKNFKRASNSHIAPATVIIMLTSHKPTYESKFNVGQKIRRGGNGIKLNNVEAILTLRR